MTHACLLKAVSLRVAAWFHHAEAPWGLPASQCLTSYIIGLTPCKLRACVIQVCMSSQSFCRYVPA
jgi:hypothetical protein